VGRAQAVGRPVLYGTTDLFLKNFGFSSLKDLPEIDDIEYAISAEEDEQNSRDYPDAQISLDI
jgi:segregation and condensation protein B